ncbi:TauD/TfdA dioxygenase family protein [Caldimonas brevitalea]|uniref:Taurine dioxygenase n=1 Tax=Caldimonas brevitalea TaxID=413882 RepID=A0A0G3BP99_9BURK|nr:TauD/TfdA family dioxygenase [Caldimonas brevitalea]AKJ31252.1 taurine dioxygenase [Caldimonas brevitalea]
MTYDAASSTAAAPSRETHTPPTAPHLEIVPVAGRIGAEIRGIRLGADLDPTTQHAIRQALWRHKVLFFRRQHHLDDAHQEALTDVFGGAPVPHPTVPVKPGSRYILELDSQHGGRADSWHTDVTFEAAYPKVSILRAVTVPAAGGDTTWANTVAAYEDLPAPLRQLADTLWAVHSNDYAARRPHASEADRERHRTVFASTVYETEHPVVQVHPDSGERALILGHFVKQFVGFNRFDSQRLFEIFQAHITRPENTVRWRWAEGDVAVWDNRATQHYAINDYGDQHRVVRRVTVDGGVAVGLDGRHSVTRSKVTRSSDVALEGASSRRAESTTASPVA